MTRKEPSSAAILAARLARAYPSLSAYSSATLAEELCAIERAQRRHAERCCSGEDGGYVRFKRWADGNLVLEPSGKRAQKEHDPDAEARAEQRIERRIAKWLDRLADRSRPINRTTPRGTIASFELRGDPRGPVLLLQLPGEAEAVAV